MSGFNGAGVYVISGAGLPYVPNSTISSTVGNTLNSDLASGLSNCICKDGQSTPTANIKMGGFKLTNLANGTVSTDAAAYGQLTSSLGSLQGFLGGLTLSTAGASGTFGIASGFAADSTNALLLSLGSAFTKTTASFSAGTGNGALDSGSIANNTWYHVFIIGAGADILISLSPTAPTLPGSFTLFRRIGSMKTDGSAHWVLFSQLGNDFLWAAAPEDFASVTPPNNAAALLTLSIPTGVKVTAQMDIRSTYNSSVDYTLVTSPDQTDVLPDTTHWTHFNQSSALEVFRPYTIKSNTSGQIRWRSAANGGGAPALIYYIFTRGWTDIRGQG